MTYTVTQEDRDAAQGFGCGFCPDDQDEYLAQAFARHRIETLERAESIVESCGDMCCGCLDAIRALKGKSDE